MNKDNIIEFRIIINNYSKNKQNCQKIIPNNLKTPYQQILANSKEGSSENPVNK